MIKPFQMQQSVDKQVQEVRSVAAGHEVQKYFSALRSEGEREDVRGLVFAAMRAIEFARESIAGEHETKLVVLTKHGLLGRFEW